MDVDDDTKVPDADAALEGAKQILVEKFAEDGELVGSLREFIWENANLVSKVIEAKKMMVLDLKIISTTPNQS